ncbi:YhgE/Pip family protein [Microbacterium keratanolyticum]|uniref:YhgE/Pip domain-containing protein n=1 Tax=Microbacterium keratanolyticum TaxID=67574 RepID=UPI003633F250
MTTLIERARSRRPVTWLTLLGVLLLPAALGGVLVAALQNPTERLEQMTAAIVNLDEPVTLDGQMVPLGRQLASGLVDGGDADSNLTWVISNEKDAAKGLTAGTYQAVVTIPEEFSAAATSGGQAVGGADVTPEQATIKVTTAPDGRVADGLITNQIAAVAASTMGTTLAETTLENVLVGFTTIGDQIGTAADGAGQLASGARDAATGAAAIPEGATKLADGAGQLGSGAGALASGLDTIASGTRDAQNGAAQLGAGLIGGADQLVANGIVPQELLGAAAVSQQNADLVAASAPGLATELGALAAECAADPNISATFCGRLGTAAATAGEMVRPALTAQGAAAGTASGLSQLAAEAPTQIASSMRTAGDAANALAGGLGQLAAGVDQSAAGARELSTGAGALSSGASELSTGAATLATGLDTLATGTSDLADGLATASRELPSYADGEAANLASVIASPVAADSGDAAMFGPTAIPLLATVVVWFGGLASFIAMRAVTGSALTSRRPSAALAWRALLPAAAIGAGQGLLVALIVQIVAGYDATAWWTFAGVAMVAGVAFAAVNQALVAVFGGVGRWISALIGVIAVATGIISTVPGWLAGIAGFLPTAPASVALIGETGAGSAVVGMLVWAVLSFLATTLAVVRRRTTSAKAVLAAA